jgi:hypothetical protein
MLYNPEPPMIARMGCEFMLNLLERILLIVLEKDMISQISANAKEYPSAEPSHFYFLRDHVLKVQHCTFGSEEKSSAGCGPKQSG